MTTWTKFKITTLAAALFFLCAGTSTANAGEYTISADGLKAVLGSEDQVILDARPQAEYKSGHIPGAINVAWEDFANATGAPGKNWGLALPTAKLASAFGRLGITGKSQVVVYADPKIGWGEDGRFLWLLRLAGKKDSRLLDGGFPAWKAGGLPVSKDVPTPKPAPFGPAKLDSSLVADTTYLTTHKGAIKVVDSRKKSEFDGAVEFGEARGGRIPGAINLHFRNVYNADGTLKSVARLKAMFNGAGLDQDDDIVVYCTAGIRSAHLTMMLRMAGFSKARNYDASFYHWAADKSLPVE